MSLSIAEVRNLYKLDQIFSPASFGVNENLSLHYLILNQRIADANAHLAKNPGQAAFPELTSRLTPLQLIDHSEIAQSIELVSKIIKKGKEELTEEANIAYVKETFSKFSAPQAFVMLSRIFNPSQALSGEGCRSS